MRVLQINKYLKIVGGAETYMFQLSKALQKQGVEVKFWGMHDKDNIVTDFFGLEADNINYSNLGLVKKFNSVVDTIYSKANKLKIAKVLDTYKPDIVHLHNYNFQITPSILLEIKKRDIKIVQTIHDSQMVCPYHRLYNFQRNETCIKCVTGAFTNCIKDRCFDDSLFKSAVGAFESYFYHSKGYYEKYIDTYISPSKFLANLIKNRVKKNIDIVPNFTKTQLKNDTDKSKDYYLYYGRLSDEKGILELIEIFKETNLNLLIIGKGSLEKEVEVKTKNNPKIDFIGPKYGINLFNIVKNAKYVVQPSKGFENCPMTIIESFSLGVPVIGANHSGFVDLIEDGKTGYLIDFSNKSKAVAKLLLINKQAMLNDMRLDVKKYYNKHLSEETHIKKVLAIYKSLLEKNYD